MERTIMNARTSWFAGTLLATVVVPWAAWAADAPARDAAPVLIAQASMMPAATAGCPGDTGLSPLERRMIAKYDSGAQSLLGFVQINRNIYLLERGTTMAWAEEYRKSHPRC
jgi:hypothetical protein